MARDPIDATKWLEIEHDKLRKAMGEIDETTDRAVKTREKLFEEFRIALKIHEAIEEEILHSLLRDQPKTKEIVLEGYEEHHAADVLVGELDDLPVDDEMWAPKFTVIKENVEHHLEEEEENMFPKARRVLDKDQLLALGRRMSDAAEELRAGVRAASS